MTGISFVTNRKFNRGSFGTRVADKPGDLRVGTVTIENDGVRKLIVLPDSERHGSTKLFDGLRGDMKTCGRDTILYVHGFNNNFEDSISEALELDRALGGAYNIVVYSWPSNGRLVIGYYPDRHDAEVSGLGLARAFLKLRAFLSNMSAEDACERKIHLIAHSMGNYVLRHALQKMQQVEGAPPTARLFDQVVLAAADEDADALEYPHKLANLSNLCNRLNIYFNQGDRALVVSDKLKGNPDRLGHDGPRHPHAVTQKTVLIDVGGVVHGDTRAQHGYIRQDPEVLSDLKQVLLGTPSQGFGHRRNYVPHANKFALI